MMVTRTGLSVSTAHESGNSHLSLRFHALKNLLAIVRSNTHHTLGGFRTGHASENVFKLSYLIDQTVALQYYFWAINSVLFKSSPLYCLTTSLLSQGTRMKSDVRLRTTGSFNKRFKMFNPLFIYTSTIHIFVYSSSTSAGVRTTDTNS